MLVSAHTGRPLGEYYNYFNPNSTCHDPDRPSWLPNWFPTTNEVRCELGWGLETQTPAPNGPVAPQTREQMTVPGAWTPEIAIQQTYEANKKLYDEFFRRAAGRLNPGTAEVAGASLVLVAGAVAVLALVVILARR